MLGDQKQAFDILKLRELLNSANTLKETRVAKLYITSYFAHCISPKGVLMWNPDKNGFLHLADKDAKHILSEEIEIITQENDKQKAHIFNIWKWFYFECKIFHLLDVDPTKSRVYQDETGQRYINKFPGFMYPNPQPYKTYSNEVQTHVSIILDHIKHVLCSNIQDQSNYMFGWLSNMISGRKMGTALFLHSGQGTGKSIITKFIQNNVLGYNITYSTSNERVIIGQFNKELEGKVLLILKEMSGSKTSDWITFANRLKEFITGNKLIIEEKGKTPYQVTNIVSLIINSNNSRAVRLDTDDRRFFIPDISDQYIGNTEYFNRLVEAMNYPKVGEAFYSLMLDFANKRSFDERKIPKAYTKQIMLSGAVHSVHTFIKANYLASTQSDLDIPSNNLYNEYKHWFKEHVSNHKKPSTIQEFSKKMQEIGLTAKQVRWNKTRKMRYQASREEIYNTYKKKGWIDDLENIEHKQIQTSLDEESPISKQQDSSIPKEESNITHKSPIAVNIVTEKITTEPLTIKKVLPKIPPKPEHLKVKNNIVKQQNAQLQEKQQNTQLEQTSSIVESQPEQPEQTSSIVESQSKQLEQTSSIVKSQSKQPEQTSSIVESQPEQSSSIVKQQNTQEQEKPDMYYGTVLEQFYKDVMENWIMHENDLDEFNWDCFIEEIKEINLLVLGNYHIIEQSMYLHDLEEIINKYRLIINGKDTKYSKFLSLDNYPTHAYIIKMLYDYGRVRETQFIAAPEGYTTVLVHNNQQNDNNKWQDDLSDEEEEFWNESWNECDSMVSKI